MRQTDALSATITIFLFRLLNRAPGQDFGGACTPPCCVYWFCWLPTNNSWSIPSLSRPLLCGWLMSTTINRVKLPAFFWPRTNPSIWVTVGSTGRQEHVWTGTYLSLWLSLFPSFSFSGSVSPSLPLSQSLCPTLSLSPFVFLFLSPPLCFLISLSLSFSPFPCLPIGTKLQYK